MSAINITRTHHDGFNPAIIKFSSVKKYLLVPIEEEAPEAQFYVISNNHRYIFNIRLAVKNVQYYVPVELDGPETYLEIYRAPKEDAIGWSKLELSDTYDDSDHEYYRPVYHFAPKYGWMNDPNGLFYLDGTYHLFYQYNPFASTWGNMSWGHATTKDFVHFDHHPVALLPDELGAIFSGSIVVDKENTAGFGKNAVIAFYTNANREDFTEQQNSMAVSTDGGFTFKKYEHNPVVTFDCPDFRDPTLIRYKNQWNLFIATKQWIRIYSSQNLKEWKFESEFGHGIGNHEGVWECPTVFECDGKWVMLLNINPGGIFGGSATQYFIGDFDGHEFKCEFPPRVVKWMDYGKDAYATVAFFQPPVVTAIAWMSNWEYGKVVPSKQFRSAFSIPRTFKLVECPKTHQHTLYSLPLPSFEANFKNKADKITEACLVELDLTGVTAKSVNIVLKNEHEQVEMQLNRHNERFYFTRGCTCGIHEFGDTFCCTCWAPYHNKDDYKIKFFIDKHSVEVFDGEGEFSMTQTVFPRHPFNQIVVDPVDGEAKYTVTIKTL